VEDAGRQMEHIMRDVVGDGFYQVTFLSETELPGPSTI
jgi:hypothetical protein